jgi:hypothetical protein
MRWPPFWPDDLPLLRQLCTDEEFAYVLRWLEDNKPEKGC